MATGQPHQKLENDVSSFQFSEIFVASSLQFACISKWNLTLNNDVKRADPRIPSFIAGVVCNSMPSCVVYAGYASRKDTWGNARVISSYNGRPAYCCVVLRPVGVAFNIIGAR